MSLIGLVIQSTPLYHLFSFLLTLLLPDEAICDTSILFNSIFPLHNFSATIPRCYEDVYVNSFFDRTARLWNSLPA